jgi:hypothetical protein
MGKLIWNKTKDILPNPDKPEMFLCRQCADDPVEDIEAAWWDGDFFWTEEFCSDTEMPELWAEIISIFDYKNKEVTIRILK